VTEAEPLRIVAHRFSNEAFELAKTFVAGDGDQEELKAKAAELRERLPQISSQMASLPDAERADVNRVLSDANLDIGYVLAGGNVPSSIRLHHLMEGG
jgi:hypothetical protein